MAYVVGSLEILMADCFFLTGGIASKKCRLYVWGAGRVFTSALGLLLVLVVCPLLGHCAPQRTEWGVAQTAKVVGSLEILMSECLAVMRTVNGRVTGPNCAARTFGVPGECRQPLPDLPPSSSCVLLYCCCHCAPHTLLGRMATHVGR